MVTRLHDSKAASLLTLQPPLLRLLEGAEQGSLPRIGRIELPSGRFVDDPNVFVRGLAQRLCLDLDDLIAVGRAVHGGPAQNKTEGNP